MQDKKPYVSIGMPVYNAERWIEEALQSLLQQTYTDFELIISDNASTDNTDQICRDYASSDRRIRYLRQPENFGAAKNFNIVFKLSSGKYFKWASYDDICAPEYLRKCVQILDADPSVVLCYPKTQCIHEDGHFLFDYDNGFKNVSSSKPQKRFQDILLVNHWVIEIWGLMRRDVLQKTPLIAPFAGSDYPLLAEIALHGKFHEIPETLFSQRRRSDERNFQTRRAWAAWFDPKQASKIVFPEWSLLFAYFNALRRAPIRPGDRIGCFIIVLRWMLKNREPLYADLEVAAKTVHNRLKCSHS